MKTVIEMAREAGWPIEAGEELPNTGSMSLERLVELARADEREKQAEAFQQILTAIQNQTRADEREACAKFADQYMRDSEGKSFGVGDAIRAWSNT